MSLGPAVPPGVRLTVVSAVGATEALITKVAAIPWATTSFTDWIVRTGVVVRGAIAGRNAVSVPTVPTRRIDVVDAAGGGPIVRPAESAAPSLYPDPCASATVTDWGVAGVELG